MYNTIQWNMQRCSHIRGVKLNVILMISYLLIWTIKPDMRRQYISSQYIFTNKACIHFVHVCISVSHLACESHSTFNILRNNIFLIYYTAATVLPITFHIVLPSIISHTHAWSYGNIIPNTHSSPWAVSSTVMVCGGNSSTDVSPCTPNSSLVRCFCHCWQRDCSCDAYFPFPDCSIIGVTVVHSEFPVVMWPSVWFVLLWLLIHHNTCCLGHRFTSKLCTNNLSSFELCHP